MGPPLLRRTKPLLAGRATECGQLDQLLAEARRGHSAVLVLRGEPGIGKSALLEHVADGAEGCRVLRATGAESEMVAAPLDASVRDRIVAEMHGNPLALLELPRGSLRGTLAGGFGLPGDGSLPGRIEASFQGRVQRLPPRTQQLLLLAAADPTGDPALLARAAAELEIPIEDLGPAEA